MSRLGSGGKEVGVEASLDRHMDSDGQQIDGTEKRLVNKYHGKARQKAKLTKTGRKATGRGRR